jgi:hypothetical protein
MSATMHGGKFYLPDGTLYDGPTHTMADGEVHTGATHTADSQVLEGGSIGKWFDHHAWAKNLLMAGALGVGTIATGGLLDAGIAGIGALGIGAETAADAAAGGTELAAVDGAETAADAAGDVGTETNQARRELASRKSIWDRLPNQGKKAQEMYHGVKLQTMLTAPTAVVTGVEQDAQTAAQTQQRRSARDAQSQQIAQAGSQQAAQSDAMLAQTQGRARAGIYMQ